MEAGIFPGSAVSPHCRRSSHASPGRNGRSSAEELKAIGFRFDAGLPESSSRNLAHYTMSVADIESITGITFFSEALGARIGE